MYFDWLINWKKRKLGRINPHWARRKRGIDEKEKLEPNRKHLCFSKSTNSYLLIRMKRFHTNRSEIIH